MVTRFIPSVNNKIILDGNKKYISETKRFDGPFFKVKESLSMHHGQKVTMLTPFLNLYQYYFILLIFYLCFLL